MRQSAIVLGWKFPVAFPAEQQEPDRFSKWNRDHSVNGHVTSIRSVPALELPEAILGRLEPWDRLPARRR